MKKIVLLCAIMAVALLQACTKEQVGPQHPQGTVKKSALRPEPSITDVEVVGNIHHDGEWVSVKWKTHHMPPGYVIFASIQNTKDGAFGMSPADHVYLSKWATDNTGEAVFQIPEDDNFAINYLYRINGTYGDGFKVSVNAVYIHPDGNYGGTDEEYGAWSTNFTVLHQGCSGTAGFSNTDGQPCSVPRK